MIGLEIIVISGKYRGGSHNTYNLNYRYSKTIPVVFHNLRGYDSHLTMQQLGKFGNKITCIPNSMEKYISFSLGKLVFIDSLQFMNSSQSKIVKNLKNSGNLLQHLNSEFKHTELLTRKGTYSYDYMDSFNRFSENTLPPRESLYSTLNDEGIHDNDYRHAQKVRKKYNINNLGEYHDLYLKSDVPLLNDVFENFKNYVQITMG
jgi:hypothetical protein